MDLALMWAGTNQNTLSKGLVKNRKEIPASLLLQPQLCESNHLSDLKYFFTVEAFL